MKDYPIITITNKEKVFPQGISQWLKAGAPSRLYYIGDIGMIMQPMTGLFSSIRCPSSLIIKAQDIAKELGNNCIHVISGFHSPIEKEMLRILIRGKGSIVLCPARGLNGIRLSPELQQVFKENRLLIISAFNNRVIRSNKEYAMQRNLIVAAIAEKVVVIHSEPGGNIESLSKIIQAWGKTIKYLKTNE